MKDGLYHFSLGFPKGFTKPNQVIKLRYGLHAQHAALNDRYGRIILPESIDTSLAQVIELEIMRQQVNKVVLRISYNNSHDLVLVIHPRDGFVRTVWLNSKFDKHKSLDKSRYSAAA